MIIISGFRLYVIPWHAFVTNWHSHGVNWHWKLNSVFAQIFSHGVYGGEVKIGLDKLCELDTVGQETFRLEDGKLKIWKILLENIYKNHIVLSRNLC